MGILRRCGLSVVLRAAIGVAWPLVAVSSPLMAVDSLGFKNRGQEIKTLTKQDILKEIPPVDLRVFETHTGREVRYRAIPLQRLLTMIYGEAWKKSEELLISCVDGYQPSIPIAKILNYPAYLAVGHADGSEFTLTNRLQNNERVSLGPFYLIWDNIKVHALRAEGASDQPYQIVGIDLIEFAARFPRMAPPQRAGDAARRGFVAFRKHCLSCHTINGQGGNKAIELNYPVSVTEYIRPEFLKKWILQPRSMRFNATMPAFSPSSADKEEVVADIVTYLEAMVQYKQSPEVP